MSNNIITQQPKQKVPIKITFEYDQFSQQDEYNRLKDERNRYIDKGFSEQQAVYFNRFNEKMMRQLDNHDLMMLHVTVTANVKMPCGHFDEFYDSLGGCYYMPYRDNLETLSSLGDYQMIENVKDQVKKALNDNNIEFTVEYDTDIKMGHW